MSKKWLRASTALWGAVLVLVLSRPGVAGHTGQDDSIELRTVVGCLTGDADSWSLDQATEGEPTERAFTSEDELEGSRRRALGSLTYRLLGVGEFGVAEHDGHKVQVKGLRLNIDGELRLNVTSFQHLSPDCQ